MTDAARPVTKMSGALRIVRVAGIDVHVHWSWALIGLVEIRARSDAYTGVGWNVAEYLGLFAIVLLHEFGHALACRSVGGTAQDILLWPLGGVAYVRPPHRPGAQLWSIAAGPLVNVLLVPVTVGLAFAGAAAAPEGDLARFTLALAVMNGIVLAFNVLPIYPLDGGQMLRALLWYFIGPYRSVVIAAGIGIVGAVAAAVLAVVWGDIWLGVFALFGAFASWKALGLARARVAIARLPRRDGFACPSCRESPPIVAAWPCPVCAKGFDPFESAAVCPSCSGTAPTTVCLFCGTPNAAAAWTFPPVTAAAAPLAAPA